MDQADVSVERAAALEREPDALTTTLTATSPLSRSYSLLPNRRPVRRPRPFDQSNCLPATVSVLGNNGGSAWTDTGCTVTAGTPLSVTASGIIYVAVDGSTPVAPKSPAGSGGPAPSTSTFPAPGLSAWSLIGSIGSSGAPFEIGPGSVFIAPTSGELYLGINDDILGDNSGSWTANVAYLTPIPASRVNSPSSRAPAACQPDPVNCATGAFVDSDTDLTVPGRGLPLTFVRTYDALNAAQDGPLGFGWTDSYNMALTTDATGVITVNEEAGTSVAFTPTPTGYQATSPSVLATLVTTTAATPPYTPTLTFTRE
jgi:hypothetical protein